MKPSGIRFNMSDNGDTKKSIPQEEHLQNPPVTKISPSTGDFPDTPGAERKFKELCEGLNKPVRMLNKRPLKWRNRDPLHFWQSLAFTLRGEALECVAVSSFVDTKGHSRLYISTNDRLPNSEEQELREIINMFLDLKPKKEISEKLIVRQFSYLLQQLNSITLLQLRKFVKEVPGELANAVNNITSQNIESETISLEDMWKLLKLIVYNRTALRSIQAGAVPDISPETEKMAYRLLKMIRLFEEIDVVWHKLQLHNQDRRLISIVQSRNFEFVSLDCHAELAILKTAMDCSNSKPLYIGVSKRPCYCCSLLFEAVADNHRAKFDVFIVTTHGKFYPNWNRIENDQYFEKEFNQVWGKVVQEYAAKRRLEQGIDDDSSLPENSCIEDHLSDYY